MPRKNHFLGDPALSERKLPTPLSGANASLGDERRTNAGGPGYTWLRLDELIRYLQQWVNRCFSAPCSAPAAPFAFTSRV